MVHIPVWIQNLGTIAPQLALRRTDKRHTSSGQLLVLAVHIADPNGERDLLSRERVGGFQQKDRQAGLVFDPDGLFEFALKRETQLVHVPFTRSRNIGNW